MNLLIDTHVLIWWSKNSRRLGRQAQKLISAPQNSIWVSSASIWEISIKVSLRRLELNGLPLEKIPEDLEHHGFSALPISFRHALAVHDLPFHHSDPFDRMLIAQAQCEDLVLLTADPSIMAYDVRTFDASR
ncbi:MAG: type II toxin-antitoxin system VapC family toxin [Bryobacteraceae bacterium]|jgi:PIN domain nuclease of toxin-antitoxin system